MRAREIYKYIENTPGNMNPAVLQQMLDSYVERVNNDLYDYTLDADIATNVDLLGKHINDLQEGVTFVDGIAYGTIKYTDKYTGFSGDPSEQQGYYVAMKFASDDADTIKVNGKALDDDGILIKIVRDISNPGTITVQLIDGTDTATDIIDLSQLTFVRDGVIVREPSTQQNSYLK